MKVEYINPFLTSTISVFDTMLGCALTRGTPYVKSGAQPEHEVSGVIGLSGKARGTVVLGLGRESALNAAEALLQERPPEINADVTDAVGELANIIAGGAKAQLEHLAMSVSLPTVITGKHHCVEFPSTVTPICIPFESEWGPVTVEVGLSEQHTTASDTAGRA
jgi:chemotaxis protein CheX